MRNLSSRVLQAHQHHIPGKYPNGILPYPFIFIRMSLEMLMAESVPLFRFTEKIINASEEPRTDDSKVSSPTTSMLLTFSSLLAGTGVGADVGFE